MIEWKCFSDFYEWAERFDRVFFSDDEVASAVTELFLGVAMKVEANFSARLNAGGGAQGSDAARFGAGAKVDPSTQATIAQTTAKAVQEALVRAGASTVPPASARVAVDASVLANVSGVSKARDPEKLDTAKLDAIKAKIESGEFEIDYSVIAAQLASMSVVSGRSGRR